MSRNAVNQAASRYSSRADDQKEVFRSRLRHQ